MVRTYDERSARQYRYEPIGVSLTLLFAAMVPHFSGPNTHALTQTSTN